MGLKFLAVDVEGNGGSPPEIVEFAACEIEPERGIVDHVSYLVRPVSPIRPFAARVHGIRPATVADCPLLEAVAPDIAELLNGNILVAHQAGVELSILRRQLPGWSPGGVVDTLQIARKLLGSVPSYRLQALCARAGVVVPPLFGERPHRALYDAAACGLLFLWLCSTARTLGLTVSALVQPAR